MASYQDIDVRLGVLERKVDFIMKLASVVKQTPSTLMPGEVVSEKISMLDLYREISTSGDDLVPVKS